MIICDRGEFGPRDLRFSCSGVNDNHQTFSLSILAVFFEMFYNTPLLHLRKIAVRESNFQGKRLEKGCLKHSLSTTFGVNSYLFCFTLFLLLTPCHLKKFGHIPAPVCYFSLYLGVVRSFLWLLKWKLLSLDQLKKDNWLF